jgi:hypothetical protein
MTTAAMVTPTMTPVDGEGLLELVALTTEEPLLALVLALLPAVLDAMAEELLVGTVGLKSQTELSGPEKTLRGHIITYRE